MAEGGSNQAFSLFCHRIWRTQGEEHILARATKLCLSGGDKATIGVDAKGGVFVEVIVKKSK